MYPYLSFPRKRESSFFALEPCFGFPQGGVPRRGDIVDFAEEYKKSFLGNSVTVARLTLDQLVQVRILVPQVLSADTIGVAIIPVFQETMLSASFFQPQRIV